MEVEIKVADIKKKYDLSSVHIFDDRSSWRIFAFRRIARGYSASTESGEGQTIAAAIADLERRLNEGPIHGAA